MIAELQMLQQLYLCFKGRKKILVLTKTELLNFTQFLYSINADNIREINNYQEKDALHDFRYLIRVLTLEASISYNFFTEALICGLLALTSTINTSVLLSSIFFMADSVVKGCLIMA